VGRSVVQKKTVTRSIKILCYQFSMFRMFRVFYLGQKIVLENSEQALLKFFIALGEF